MAKSKRPPEQKRNGYSDEDLAQINERLDAAEEKRDGAVRSAKDAFKREVKVIEAEAKSVNILVGALKIARKVRGIEATLSAEIAKIKRDEIEVFHDMYGQMSFLKPADGETAAQAAARKHADDVAEVTEREQADGEAVLDELAGEAVH